MRRGRWRVLAAGILLTRPDEPTREDWADVGVHLAGPGAAVTGWDALHVRGLVTRNPPPLVVVLSPTAMNRVVGGVRIRRTQRPFDRRWSPLGAPYELTPIAQVPRALADCALDVDRSATMAAVSRALQRHACSVDALYAEYHHGPRNRSAGLRQALLDVLDGARSVAEATAARRLAAGPIPRFELNVPVLDASGRVCYVLDQCWRELRAAVEIDSREHHFSEADWQKTLKRHNALTRAGLSVLHYAPTLVTCRGSTYVQDVADWLVGRATELGLQLPPGRGVLRPAPDHPPDPIVLPRLRMAPPS